jgi:Xaa-Pro aminopeptidase
MGEAARLLRELEPGLTSERIRATMQEICRELGCDLDDDVIVSHGPQSAIGHEKGHGEIGRGEPVVVDIWPRDRASRCFADMTRTFVAGGEAPAEIEEYWRLNRAALDAVLPEIRPGASARALFDRTCDVFEAAGQPTQRTAEPGRPLDHGFFHSLGHGVGLAVHEAPVLGLDRDPVLVAGDVITLEPGCYRPGFGGSRLEDLVLVTDDGAEILTDFPYDLAP